MDILVFIGCVVVAALVLQITLSVMARREYETYVQAPRAQVIDLVRDHFGSVWWRQIKGEGDLNFEPKGFGVGSVGMMKPTVSVNVVTHDNGNTEVVVGMTEWGSKFGLIGYCDRVVFKSRKLMKKLESLEVAGAAPLH
ncbi:hypothetical protein [Smaragdicoccus niigatensis]|uniref:hypothetical protein n=1 Tax=Smaragdicoccus niigatensis TaxID=359359 RepID=UPI00037C92D2|nr:hypothetical protein [Smaragdicoccus niigatensis]